MTTPHPLLEPKKFTIKGTFTGTCVSVYDGDTITVSMKFRQEQPELFKIRLLHINTPGLAPRRNNPNRDQIKQAAFAARNYLRKLVLKKAVTIECEGLDSFGCLLSVVRNSDLFGTVNDMMISSGHASPYLEPEASR